jgi:hypothetical protein
MKNLVSFIVVGIMLFASVFTLAACSKPKQYTITVDPNIEHGTITVSHEVATPGEEIIISFEAEQGYTLDYSSLKANGEMILAFSFVMPNKNVLITAKFIAISAPVWDVTEDIRHIAENIYLNHMNKQNTNGDEREVVEVDDDEIFIALLGVPEDEEYELKFFNTTMTPTNMEIALGNNRYIQAPLFKKQDSVLYLFAPALHMFVIEDALQVWVNDQSYAMLIENNANQLAVYQAKHNGQDLQFEQGKVNVDNFENDIQLKFAVGNSPVNTSHFYVSSITIYFDDQTHTTIFQCGLMDSGNVNFELLHNLPQDKQIASYNVNFQIVGAGFAQFEVLQNQ